MKIKLRSALLPGFFEALNRLKNNDLIPVRDRWQLCLACGLLAEAKEEYSKARSDFIRKNGKLEGDIITQKMAEVQAAEHLSDDLKKQLRENLELQLAQVITKDSVVVNIPKTDVEALTALAALDAEQSDREIEIPMKSQITLNEKIMIVGDDLQVLLPLIRFET